MADTWRYVQAVSWAAVREFTVTEDHLKLLRHACLYSDYGEGYGAPAINPKRPYGNSDVERDIAEILDAPDSDWEWDEDDEYLDLTTEAREHFTRLHVETMLVLHIALGAARDPLRAPPPPAALPAQQPEEPTAPPQKARQAHRSHLPMTTIPASQLPSWRAASHPPAATAPAQPTTAVPAASRHRPVADGHLMTDPTRGRRPASRR